MKIRSCQPDHLIFNSDNGGEKYSTGALLRCKGRALGRESGYLVIRWAGQNTTKQDYEQVAVRGLDCHDITLRVLALSSFSAGGVVFWPYAWVKQVMTDIYWRIFKVKSQSVARKYKYMQLNRLIFIRPRGNRRKKIFKRNDEEDFVN